MMGYNAELWRADDHMQRIICAAHVLDKAKSYLLLDREEKDWDAYELIRQSEADVRQELAIAAMYQLASVEMISRPCDCLQAEDAAESEGVTA